MYFLFLLLIVIVIIYIIFKFFINRKEHFTTNHKNILEFSYQCSYTNPNGFNPNTQYAIFWIKFNNNFINFKQYHNQLTCKKRCTTPYDMNGFTILTTKQRDNLAEKTLNVHPNNIRSQIIYDKNKPNASIIINYNNRIYTNIINLTECSCDKHYLSFIKYIKNNKKVYLKNIHSNIS